MFSRFSRLPLLLFALGALGCTARYEAGLQRDLRAAGHGLTPLERTEATAPDGTLASYVRYALAESPALRASYERWRAASLRIEPSRRLPEPMVTYGYYAMPVQTRVGPQRHRLMVRQEFPWPTKLTAAADAQSARARAAQRRFEARALALRMQVAEAWWRLWAIRESRAIEREQLDVLTELSHSLLGRIEVGQATLADVAQVELTRARLEDTLAGLDEQERGAEAALRAAIGAPDDLPAPTARDVAPPALPGAERAALAEAVREHPYLRAFALMAEASRAHAASLEADRFPRFSLGVDWIETGPALMPATTQGSGQDALILNVGVTLPIWQGAYADAQEAAEADSHAELADHRAAEDAALAELTESLARLRDTYRRVQLYEHTLVPEAQSAYESVVGSYVTGRSTVASTLIAERDLLELGVALARVRAEHGAAWARLERVVGHPVEPVAPESAAGASEPEAPAGEGPEASDDEERNATPDPERRDATPEHADHDP